MIKFTESELENKLGKIYIQVKYMLLETENTDEQILEFIKKQFNLPIRGL